MVRRLQTAMDELTREERELEGWLAPRPYIVHPIHPHPRGETDNRKGPGDLSSPLPWESHGLRLGGAGGDPGGTQGRGPELQLPTHSTGLSGGTLDYPGGGAEAGQEAGRMLAAWAGALSALWYGVGVGWGVHIPLSSALPISRARLSPSTPF